MRSATSSNPLASSSSFRSLVLLTVVLVPLQLSLNALYATLVYDTSYDNDAHNALCAFTNGRAIVAAQQSSINVVRMDTPISTEAPVMGPIALTMSLHVSCDDLCSVYVDGERVQFQHSWRQEHKASIPLERGVEHVIAIDAFNDRHMGGVAVVATSEELLHDINNEELSIHSGDGQWQVFEDEGDVDSAEKDMTITWHKDPFRPWTPADTFGTSNLNRVENFPDNDRCEWMWKGERGGEGRRLKFTRTFTLSKRAFLKSTEGESARDVDSAIARLLERIEELRTLSEEVRLDGGVHDETEQALLDTDAFIMYAEGRLKEVMKSMKREHYPMVRDQPLFREHFDHKNFFENAFDPTYKARFRPFQGLVETQNKRAATGCVNLGPAPLHDCDVMQLMVVHHHADACQAVISGTDVQMYFMGQEFERRDLEKPFPSKHPIQPIYHSCDRYRHEKHEYLERLFRPSHIAYMEKTLYPLLEKLARPVNHGLDHRSRGAIVAMVVNRGHLDQLLNFRCSTPENATHNTLVMPVEEDTAQICEDIGFTVYHEEDMFRLDQMPSKESHSYGDRTFMLMMWMKTIIVHVCLQHGYDVLFQDADLVWMDSPWEVFEEPEYQYYDIMLMSEMVQQHRFNPYWANSGYFYIRNNYRTRAAWEYLVMRWDQMMATHTQQSLVNDMMVEHAHMGLLRVGMLLGERFMNGWYYSRKPQLMLDIAKRDYRPVVFHQNWTLNKKYKLEHWHHVKCWFLSNATQCANPKGNYFKGPTDFDDQCCVDPVKFYA